LAAYLQTPFFTAWENAIVYDRKEGGLGAVGSEKLLALRELPICMQLIGTILVL